MISELIRIAELNGITGWEANRRYPIHWFIELDSTGHVVGFSPTTVSSFTKSGERKDSRGKEFTVPANYHMQWKNEKVQSVCTNDSNWLPDFLCGPANEIFPAGVAGNRIYRLREVIAVVRRAGAKHPDRNRLCKLGLWRRLVFKAEREKPMNPTIKAIANFIRHPHQLRFADLQVSFEGEAGKRLLESLDEGKETLSFRVNGRIAVADPDLRQWWERQVRRQRVLVRRHLTVGADAYQPGKGRVTDYFPTVFSSIPFASFNAAPFTSYGLGSQTTTMRLETAEKTSAGLNWLLSRDDTRLNLADETAVFWAMPKDQETGKARASAVPFVRLLEKADTLAVRDFLRGIWGGRPIQIDSERFYAATLLPGQGRFSVRSWHTDTLPRAQENLKNWFNALSLDSPDEGTPTLNQLAEATISKAKRQKSKPAPATYSALFESALFRQPLPHQIFAAAVSRQQIEMAGQDHTAKPFSERLRARTSLIQLYFILNKGITMNETYDRTTVRPEHRTAFLCGRLLAVLDHIHDKAHEGKSASSPATRLYGAASKTPALAFPQLCQLVRHHLDKLSTYDRDRFQDGVPAAKRADGVNENFDGLCDVVAQLKEAAGGAFPRMLSLEEQGVFAIGFYYQRKRCEDWPHFKKKNETSNNETQTATPTT
jgi:CRISPR-associated protein Csd1